MLLLLDAAAALAATGTATPLVLRRVRLRADRRWRRHETIRYAACLRNIDRLEHELGIGVAPRPVAVRATNLTLLESASQHKQEIERHHYWGNYAGSATMATAPGTRWLVDHPDNVRELRKWLDDDDADDLADLYDDD